MGKKIKQTSAANLGNLKEKLMCTGITYPVGWLYITAHATLFGIVMWAERIFKALIQAGYI